MRVFVLLIAVEVVWSSDVTTTTDIPCTCFNLSCPRNWQRNLVFRQTKDALVGAYNELRTGGQRGAPNTEISSDEVAPIGRLVIRQTLSVGDSSVVHIARFGLLEAADPEVPKPHKRHQAESTHTQVVVKYFDDCRLRASEIERIYGSPKDERKISAILMNEYVMLKVLNTTGLAPHVLYISDALVLDTQMTGVPERMESAFLNRYFATCTQHAANIRYMILEQVGPSVLDYFRWVQGDFALYSSTEFTRRVLVVALKMVRLLEQLHALGIVHGDLHAGNVAFRRRVSEYSHINVDEDDIVLLDFEWAAYYPSLIGGRIENHAITRERNRRLRPELLSPWQNLDERPAPRDDVYRVFLVMAEWITRHRFKTGYKSLLKTNLETKGNPAKGTSQYKRVERDLTDYIRRHSPMFEYSFALGSVAIIGDDHIIPSEQEIEIKHKLEKLHGFVAAYNHPDKAIDYQHIDAELDSILSLFP